ncbi:MAG: hypothetical protein Aurels2KO_45190 [Aureliella sp.]
MRTRTTENRTGASALELGAALVVLSLSTIIVGKFSLVSAQANRAHANVSDLQRALLNYREQIGTWPSEQITSGRIESSPPPDVRAAGLVDLRWSATVEEVHFPQAALRVHLSIVGQTASDTTAEPIKFVFWVPVPSEGDTR